MKTNLDRTVVISLIVGVSSLCFAFKSIVSTVEIKKIIPAGDESVVVNFSRSDFNFKNIEFDTDQSAIRPAYYPELDKLAVKLKDTKASLKVSGFADSRGPYVYNWKLSQRRAEAVKAYIVNKGCDSTKIAATEFGETNPIASNKTAYGRKKNRRVQMEAY